MTSTNRNSILFCPRSSKGQRCRIPAPKTVRSQQADISLSLACAFARPIIYPAAKPEILGSQLENVQTPT
jgi:hypothetical protein